MICNKNCIHYPVCELKKYDFANIDECMYYAEERPKGKWIDHSDETILFGGVTYTPPFTCSECGKTALNEPWRYCPNCGADMRGDDND